jgi:c-di-GMP-binding flagellar brake protein YcgR
MTSENRIYPRREINRPANMLIPFRCTLADISRGGARLLLDDVAALPDELVIELRPGLVRWCQIVRREANQVAVKFIEPPKNYLLD